MAETLSADLGARAARAPKSANTVSANTVSVAPILVGTLDALNSNARSVIPSQSFSYKRKCIVIDAKESLWEVSSALARIKGSSLRILEIMEIVKCYKFWKTIRV